MHADHPLLDGQDTLTAIICGLRENTGRLSPKLQSFNLFMVCYNYALNRVSGQGAYLKKPFVELSNLEMWRLLWDIVIPHS